jgi:ankyrin repeat protein
MAISSRNSIREKLATIENLDKTNQINSTINTKVGVNYADLILITLDDDFQSETESLLQSAQSHNLKTKEVLVKSSDDGTDLKEKIQNLHSQGSLGPDTQVIVSMHGGVEKGIHVLGGTDGIIISTGALLKLLRNSPEGEDTGSWNGLIHLNCCHSADAFDELATDNEDIFSALGACIFYGGHKEQFSADGFETQLELVRLIGQDCTNKKNKASHTRISPIELFHHAASISGEKITLISNGITQRSNPSTPNIGTLEIDSEKMNAQTVRALHSRLNHSSIEKVKQILSKSNKSMLNINWNNKKPIHIATSSKRDPIDKTQELLNAGADINGVDKNGMTALHYAVQGGNLKLVDFLIKAGADFTIVDKSDLRAIDLAILKKNTEIVTLLVKAGSDINQIHGNNYSTLSRAITSGNAEMIEAMIEHGKLNYSQNDKDGMNIFAKACSVLKSNLIIKMLRQGADPMKAGPNGLAPIAIAAMIGNIEVMAALLTVPNPFWPAEPKGQMLINLSKSSKKIEMTEFLENFRDKNNIL